MCCREPEVRSWFGSSGSGESSEGAGEDLKLTIRNGTRFRLSLRAAHGKRGLVGDFAP